MEEITVIENMISPAHRPSYVVDWVITYLCNLDCSYCGSHDNNSKHPDKEECKKSIDFALKYADLTLSVKKKFERSVTFNILGGEPLLHPDFPELLQYLHHVHQTNYKDRWPLTVVIMTNGILSKKQLKKCLPYIDYITVSYHTESNEKQKRMCVDSIYTIKATGRPLNVRLMAHSDPSKFDECVQLAKRFDQDGITYSYKPIGTLIGSQIDWKDDNVQRHQYKQDQATHIVKFWNSRNKAQVSVDDFVKVEDQYVVSSNGYPCCGEKPLCVNKDRKNPVNLITQTNFKGWYCSVNWQFLHIQQHTGRVYHNTSCLVNYDNEVGPIGYLSDAQQIIDRLQNMIDSKTVNVIQCPKSICGCGICAPKAKSKEDFENIMKLRLDTSVLKF
jgi:molybdenum cofactor biosynthesis enzyme MoaA